MLGRIAGLIRSRPLASQMVASGVIGTAGDALCQFAVEKRSIGEYDLVRGVKFFALPCFYIAPLLSRWFHVLERVKGPAKWLPLKRLAIDQLFWAPPFQASILFVLNMMDSLDPRESWNKMTAVYVDVLTKGWQFWPFVQALNFYVIPFQFRVIVVQFAALLWNSYLSFKTQNLESAK